MAEAFPIRHAVDGAAAANLQQAAAAGLAVRLAAMFVDLCLVGVVTTIAINVFGVETVTGGSPLPPGGSGFARFSTSNFLAWPAGLAITVTYFLLFEALFRATPGKRICGLRVASANGGEAGLTSVLVRNALRPVDMFGLFINLLGPGVVGLPALVLGYAVVPMTRLHQRLGDLAAGTVVAPRRADAPRSKALTLKLAILLLLLAALGAVALAFDYYGRPPLVIQGSVNTRSGVASRWTNYRLGTPTWHSDTVVYPVSFVDPVGKRCSGSVTLRWHGFVWGWEGEGAESRCG